MTFVGKVRDSEFGDNVIGLSLSIIRDDREVAERDLRIAWLSLAYPEDASDSPRW